MARPHELTAREMAAAFQRRSLSPVEVTRALLARIEAWESRINAMYRVSAELAIGQAQASEARWREGKPLSALDGVPVTIKENIATPRRSGAHRHARQRGRAAPARRRAAGRSRARGGLRDARQDHHAGLRHAVLGLSSLHGITRNPWRLESQYLRLELRRRRPRSPGLRAAASRHRHRRFGAPAGRIRAVSRLKPPSAASRSIPPFIGCVVGPMTRTVTDAALLMNVIAAPDRRLTSCRFPPMMRFHRRASMSSSRAGVRIGSPVRDGRWPRGSIARCARARRGGREGCSAGARLPSSKPIRSFLTEEMLDGVCRFFEARSVQRILAPAAGGQAEKVLPVHRRVVPPRGR